MILTTPFSAAFALGPWLLDHLLALFPLGPPPLRHLKTQGAVA